MKIIEPSYEILQCPDGEQCLAFLERCARTCYKSEDKIEKGQRFSREDQYFAGAPEWRVKPSSHKLIRHVLERGHESVIEHMVITVKFIVDRGVSHELVRHRLCAFSQESTRYVRYTEEGAEGHELTFIKPCFWKWDGPLDSHSKTAVLEENMSTWFRSMLDVEQRYQQLLDGGATPEQARSVLPNSLKTEIVTTANLREWRHILKLRTSPKAHPQMRQVMQPLLEELRKRIPIIFEEL